VQAEKDAFAGADVAVDAADLRPLRIALLGYRSHPHVGGQGIYLKYLSRALLRLGHSVDVLSGPPYPELDPEVRLVRIPSLDLYATPNHIRALRWCHLRSFTDTFEWWSMATGGFAEPYAFGRRALRYLREHRDQYDLIHDNQSLCYGLLGLQDLGIPVVATVHHPITRDRDLALAEASGWGHRLLIRRWYSFLGMQANVVRQLHHVVTVSECSRRDIATEFGRPERRIHVIGNGVDTDLFRPRADIARVPYRIITTTSSDQPLKGFAVLLEALRLVRTEQPKAHLVVIGKLQPDGRNERLLRQLQLQHCVSFRNGIRDDELVDEYARASVAVCPSLYEGFGLPAAEAMSCGVPLVCSAGGALPEVVGEAGILTPPGDAQALAEGIGRVLNNRVLAQALMQMGRQRIASEFCWDRVAAQLTLYYLRQVLVDNAGPVKP
jgi:glycosyltransferase involved in cell wall biosynthesis